MKGKSGYAAFACLFVLGACAHAPQAAIPSTHEQLSQIPLEVVTPAVVESDVATKASGIAEISPGPAGIDLGKHELPMHYNEHVQEYIDLFSVRRRATFTNWLRRMGRYREMIEEQLDARGLPREFVYVPLIESMYDANAASGASAVGLWQFMSGTARAEGLEVNEYVDERRDPVRSTEAAVKHLAALYNQFGSWYLTAAAYNSGSTRIARLLKQNGYTRGTDDSFWQMQDALPKETRNYVPKLIAAVLVGENAETFGLSTNSETPMQFETVTVPGRTELRAVARAAGVSHEDIKALNHHFIKGMTPPARQSKVRIPIGAAAGFQEAFANIPKEERTRSQGKNHVVQSGETLSAIARKYGTSVEAITRLNRITRPDAVAVGRKLIIPSGV